MRVSARGISTSLRMSTDRRRASLRVTSLCSSTASSSCQPIFLTGLSDVIGSWKIIPIRRPRTFCRRAPDAPRISSPSKRTEPSTWAWRRSTSPISVRNVTLFPEPDSPTTPSVSPRSSWKLTPETALTIPSSVRKRVCRSVTSRIATSGREPDSRIEPRVRDVDEEVEDDHGQRREDDDPDDDGEVVPVRRLDQLCAEPAQVEHRLGEDGAAEREADVHTEDRHDRQQAVAQHMLEQNARAAGSFRPRRPDVVLA